jgi:MarR family transcriptional regulator for hemolysin
MTIKTYQGGLLFTQAHKAVRGRIYDVLEPYNLNPSYWSILGSTIATPDGIRLASVAKAMDVKAPLVTMLSNDLIEMGLINRIPHHTDKRAKLLVATAKGKQIAAEIEKKLNEEIGSLLNGLTADEVASFQKVLERIIQNASN